MCMDMGLAPKDGLVMGIKVICSFFIIPVDGGEVQSFQFQAVFFIVAEITCVRINTRIFRIF